MTINDYLRRIKAFDGGEPGSRYDIRQKEAEAGLRSLLRRRRLWYVLSGVWLLDAVFPYRGLL